MHTCSGSLLSPYPPVSIFPEIAAIIRPFIAVAKHAFTSVCILRRHHYEKLVVAATLLPTTTTYGVVKKGAIGEKRHKSFLVFASRMLHPPPP